MRQLLAQMVAEARRANDIERQQHMQDTEENYQILESQDIELQRVKGAYEKSVLRWMIEQEAFEKYISSIEKDLKEAVASLTIAVTDGEALRAETLRLKQLLSRFCQAYNTLCEPTEESNNHRHAPRRL
jgi:hypothetical protein